MIALSTCTRKYNSACTCYGNSAVSVGVDSHVVETAMVLLSCWGHSHFRNLSVKNKARLARVVNTASKIVGAEQRQLWLLSSLCRRSLCPLWQRPSTENHSLSFVTTPPLQKITLSFVTTPPLQKITLSFVTTPPLQKITLSFVTTPPLQKSLSVLFDNAPSTENHSLSFVTTPPLQKLTFCPLWQRLHPPTPPHPTPSGRRLGVTGNIYSKDL